MFRDVGGGGTQNLKENSWHIIIISLHAFLAPQALSIDPKLIIKLRCLQYKKEEIYTAYCILLVWENKTFEFYNDLNLSVSQPFFWWGYDFDFGKLQKKSWEKRCQRKAVNSLRRSLRLNICRLLCYLWWLKVHSSTWFFKILSIFFYNF